MKETIYFILILGCSNVLSTVNAAMLAPGSSLIFDDSSNSLFLELLFDDVASVSPTNTPSGIDLITFDLDGGANSVFNPKWGTFVSSSHLGTFSSSGADGLMSYALDAPITSGSAVFTLTVTGLDEADMVDILASSDKSVDLLVNWDGQNGLSSTFKDNVQQINAFNYEEGVVVIPEPSLILLCGLGLCALATRRHKK